MDLLKMKDDLNKARIHIGNILYKREMLSNTIDNNLLRITSAKEELDILDKTAILLQNTAKMQRSFVTSQIENIGTAALQYVYGADFKLLLELKQDSKKTSCEVYVVEKKSDGTELVRKPHKSRGGGVVDVVSLALRFAIIQVFNDPSIDGPVFLDEPGKHVSKDYSVFLSDFIKSASDRQQILITHNEFLAESGDKAIRVTKQNSISVIEEIL